MYKIWKKKSKVTRKLGEYIFSHENPKSFWGPKAGPRPHAQICSLRSPDSALLRRQDRADPSWGPPLDQILDPLLNYSGQRCVAGPDRTLVRNRDMYGLIARLLMSMSFRNQFDDVKTSITLYSIKTAPKWYKLYLDSITEPVQDSQKYLKSDQFPSSCPYDNSHHCSLSYLTTYFCCRHFFHVLVKALLT